VTADSTAATPDRVPARTGRRLLCMSTPSTGQHAYCGVVDDIFPSCDEAGAAMAMS
jgi:hypothetical protein